MENLLRSVMSVVLPICICIIAIGLTWLVVGVSILIAADVRKELK